MYTKQGSSGFHLKAMEIWASVINLTSKYELLVGLNVMQSSGSKSLVQSQNISDTAINQR